MKHSKWFILFYLFKIKKKTKHQGEYVDNEDWLLYCSK